MTSDKIELGRAPEGYRTVTPYIVTSDVLGLISFLENAFSAEQSVSYKSPDGHIIHAEVRVGDSMIMLGEPWDQGKLWPGMIHLYVKDADAVYNRAVKAGATSLRAPETQDYGDRSAGVTDPFGNEWWFATRLEDLSEEEIKKRTNTT